MMVLLTISGDFILTIWHMCHRVEFNVQGTRKDPFRLFCRITAARSTESWDYRVIPVQQPFLCPKVCGSRGRGVSGTGRAITHAWWRNLKARYSGVSGWFFQVLFLLPLKNEGRVLRILSWQNRALEHDDVWRPTFRKFDQKSSFLI